MDLQMGRDLRRDNTFGTPATAQFFAEVEREEDLIPLLSSLTQRHRPPLILGDGSNMLFTGHYPGIVIRINTRGMEVIGENEEEVLLKVAAGEVWDRVVEYCVDRGWGGVENLSLIPGRVGAAPVQNIGAYGVELKEVLQELEAVHLETGERRTFRWEECRFGYRTSVFKTTLRGRYAILTVSLLLQKSPRLHLGYGSIQEEIRQAGVTTPTVRTVREAVCRIRRNKLPDPSVTGNAGSFFRNPVIRPDQFSRLRKQYSAIVSYPDPDGVKLAAAWLIEQCGWKGKRSGDAGVHPDQPLVLVNYGGATGEQILDLASNIRQSVYSRFGILLEPEVNIV